MPTFIQLICIQLLLLIISHQVLTKPTDTDSFDALVNAHRNLRPFRASADGNFDDMWTEEDDYETFRQHLLPKLAKRRAKANLAGLWGVPTKFA
ncbi:unnamed protein product [Adineta ricciae]|uniref:Uncharacterized protein n=1 Tax=Adineta ricciae TaxID=249248 RepID=A0A815ZR03_ADIRI|nr:unnamed protein product [Adineta ricciae]CAF1586613.1 unnamed protein product [Adineta ricciae]